MPHRAHGQFTTFQQTPSPAWDLLALEHYALPMVNKPYVLVETSRGCPYTCDFCVAPIHQGHKFRERSAKVAGRRNRDGRTASSGSTSSTSGATPSRLNVKSFTAFCDELIARNLPIQWFGNARADNLTDPAFVHRLKKAGCWMLALGIESESEEVRKDMTKRLERAEDPGGVQEHARRRHQVVRVFHLRLSGRDAETMDVDDDAMPIELDPDFANFYPAVPYPGHRALREVRARRLAEAGAGRTGRRWSTWYYMLRGNGLDERIVMDAINRAKRRFFLRPSYISRHLGDVARLALTKQAIVWQVLSRTVFGSTVVPTSQRQPAVGGHQESQSPS